MAGKSKSDTVQALVTAGGQLVDWPLTAVAQHPRHQGDCDQVFTEVMETRPRDSWSGPQINWAATYAVMVVEYRETLKQLTEMGWLAENKRGTVVISPMAHVGQQQLGEIIRLANKLKLSATDDPRVIASQTAIGNKAGARLTQVTKDSPVDWTQVTA